jgi:hypothetical protein
MPLLLFNSKAKEKLDSLDEVVEILRTFEN